MAVHALRPEGEQTGPLALNHADCQHQVG